MKNGTTNPRDFKARLAKEIVARYHGESVAAQAESNFVHVFKNKEIPQDIKTIKVSAKTPLVDVLVNENILSSKAEWRRLVSEGGVYNMDTKTKITDSKTTVQASLTLRLGKRKFVRINPN